ncbi:MAG: hypothetical protein AAGM38_02475 [Pseudomonadota bacterium]
MGRKHVAEQGGAAGRAAAPQDDAERGETEDLARLARAYWRLWRRNWRPPFPEDDAPCAAREKPGAS